MLSLDVARVRRGIARVDRATLRPSRPESLQQSLPSFPPLLPHATTKRPDLPTTAPVADRPLASLKSRVMDMRPRLVRGISREEAREHLDVLDQLLDCPLVHGELVDVGEALGLIVSRSSMSPADVEFPKIVDRFTAAAADRLSDFSALELCRLIWSYGCFGPSIVQIRFRGVRKFVSQICLRLETDRVPSLPMSVLLFHGLQKMRYKGHAATTYQILRRTGPMLKYPETDMNDLAKLVLLAGKLRVEEGHQFLRQAGRAAKHRMHEFSDVGLRDFVMGFVCYDIHMMPSLFDVLSAEVRSRIDVISVTHLIQITLSLGKIRYLPEEDYLQSFGCRLRREVDGLRRRDVAHCLQAMGMMGMQDETLVERLRAKFHGQCVDMSTVDICHVLLALARLQAIEEEDLKIGLSGIGRELAKGVTKAQRLMLHQVLTHANVFLGMTEIPDEIFPNDWQSACRDAWLRDQERIMENTASILKTVELLGLEWKTVTSKTGDIRIIVVASPSNDRPVVLDVVYRKKDCFINQRGRPEPLPWKLWQWRVLKEQGYEVLSLNEAEWMQVPEASKLRHLGTKLGFWTMEALMDMEIRLGMRDSKNLKGENF